MLYVVEIELCHLKKHEAKVHYNKLNEIQATES